MTGILLLFCLGAMPAGARPQSDLQFPDSKASLNGILARARESVESFWSQFRSVTCIEKVSQEKLGDKGKTEYAQKSTFDYLILLNVEGNNLSVEESRVQLGKTAKAKKIPLLLTSGIPTLLLVFHPFYQESFQYQFEGEELLEGHRLIRVGFTHIPGRRSTTALRLRDRNFPLEIQGKAWLYPETGTIYRISAGLIAPMSEHNLKSLTLEVLYGPQKFPPPGESYWLPLTATININTERQHWRNVHQYSNYKRFTVNTEDKIEKAGTSP